MSTESSSWFDYALVDISSKIIDQNAAQRVETRSFDPRKSKEQESGEERYVMGDDISHKIFVERVEMFAQSKQIHNRLRKVARVREQELIACFEKAEDEAVCEVRRRCFCESIGPKFCAVCRRKLCKKLNDDLPRILEDVKESRGREWMIKREVMESPEPSLPRRFQQAFDSINVSNETKTLVLPQESRTSLCNSVSDDDIVSDVPVAMNSSLLLPSAPSKGTFVTDTSLILPTVEEPSGGEDNHPLSTVIPKLPVTNDCRSGLRYQDSDFLVGQKTSFDTESDYNNLSTRETPTDEARPSQLSHISLPDINRKQKSSVSSQSVPGLTLHSYPVQPVLMDLKYINFSIYEREKSF